MSNFYNTDLKNGNLPTAGNGWVYASEQYKIYHITPSVKPDTRDKWDRVGHSIMNSVNPDYVCIRSYTGEISMVVGATRWDLDSLKQTLDRECFQSVAGDVTYTVEDSTGIWGDGTIDAEYSSISTPKVDENFTYWQNSTVLDNDDDVYYLSTIRTQATRTNNTEDDWIGDSDQQLITAAGEATNFNLGNYFDGTGRHQEFPLDLSITNGSYLRLYHIDLDEVEQDDWNLVTGAAEESGVYDGTGRNLYDYGDYMSLILGTVNPLMYCFGRDHSDESVDNRLYFFTENDKLGAGSGFALSELLNLIGGDLEQDGTVGENDAGMVVVAPYFIKKT